MPNSKKAVKISDWYGLKIDRERLLEYAKMPVAARLQWLEEANKFLHSIADQNIKERRRKFRAGEI